VLIALLDIRNRDCLLVATYADWATRLWQLNELDLQSRRPQPRIPDSRRTLSCRWFYGWHLPGTAFHLEDLELPIVHQQPVLDQHEEQKATYVTYHYPIQLSSLVECVNLERFASVDKLLRDGGESWRSFLKVFD